MTTSDVLRFRRLRRFTDREPFEVYISALCVIFGIPLVLRGAGPNTIEETLPDVLVALWGIELVLGGILTLTGLGIENARLERAGLTFLAAAALVYGTVLLFVAWPAGAIAAAVTIGFGLACLARRSSMRRTITLHTRPEKPDETTETN